jgi:hypothetical protein
VHIVELGLELETELHLFLMVFGVLVVLLLEFDPDLSLILPIFLKLITPFLERFKLLLKLFLVVSLFLEACLI